MLFFCNIAPAPGAVVTAIELVAMDPIVARVAWANSHGLLAVAMALVGLAALAWRRPQLAGTTLIAPWIWSLLALAALAGTEIAIARVAPPTPDWAAPLRFAAAVSTICPAVALLGAKRPQDRGWQLIVVSLWAILSLPSIEWLLFGGPREIHPARFWFLLVLVGIGAAGGVGTRYWPSSALFCIGQLLLVAPFLFDVAWLAGANGRLWGTAALVLAWTLVAAGFPRAPRATLPLDRVWLDFRDEFGVVWALRIMERINASARMYAWNALLTWHGFQRTDGEAADAIPPAVEESLRTLLRRFVSPEWIDVRLQVAASATPRADDSVVSPGA